MLDVWHLRNINLLDGIDPIELDNILEVTQTQGFKRGEIIFEPHEHPHRLYLLHHGKVKSYTLTPKGDEWILQLFHPGDAFGGLLMGVAEGVPIWTEALDQVVVSTMNEDSFKQFQQIAPNTCFRLFRYMSNHHARTIHALRQLIHLKATYRLVITLLNLAQSRPQIDSRDLTIDGGYTHSDIANLIGVRRTTVSELISELRKNGILGGTGRQITICKPLAIYRSSRSQKGDRLMQAMIGKMAKMYPMLIMVGVLIVIISFFVGFNNSQAAAEYFAVDKITRETTLMDQRAAIASVDAWLPFFKFFGLGLILGGIVMALRVIIDELRQVGKTVLPTKLHSSLPTPPWYGLMMPMVMMLGMVIFIIAIVVGFQNASLASDIFSNPAPVIDSAGADSVLLGQVQQLHTIKSWLIPFKFFGIATMFLSITMGLGTIVFILTEQTRILDASLSGKSV
ncbi:MAG: Crp/Fnr family transcriptional regulator [Anaerolineae bacterium]|nr:Crp/Fnr family transcriptional regulator [Anaerolineae bacterium]